MNTQSIFEDIQNKIKDIEIRQNENMAKHTSFKVGGNADIWIKVKKVEQLKQIIEYAKEKSIPLTIIGNGSNVIVKDRGIRGITLQLDFQEIKIEERGQKVEVLVQAGVKLGMLATILQKRGIGGFEFASRNSRNHWRSNSYECWSLWQGNERNCKRSYIFTRRWSNSNFTKRRTKFLIQT